MNNDADFEVARKSSRQQRAQLLKAETKLRNETYQLLLKFYTDPTNISLIESCTSTTDPRLWRAIFKHVYGRYPRDTYTWKEQIEYALYLLKRRFIPVRKVPLRPTRPPHGATDPYWDDLFSTRAALKAHRHVIMMLETTSTQTSLASSPVVKAT